MKADIDWFLNDEKTVRHFTYVVSFNHTCSFNRILKGWMAVILYITQNTGKFSLILSYGRVHSLLAKRNI